MSAVGQLDLFGDAPVRRPVEVVDRLTGLPVVVLREQQADVLEAVVALDGGCAWEVQCWLRDRGRHVPETNAVGSRFNELSKAGWVSQIGDGRGRTGKPQHAYRATPEGKTRLVQYLAATT